MKSSMFKIMQWCFVSGLVTHLFAQSLSLEQVIREVCANSDSVKMMNETAIKSKQMIRERWSAVYPTISFSTFGGLKYPIQVYSMGLERGHDFNPGTVRSGMAQPYGFPMKNVDTTVYTSSIQLMQTLYTFGKVGSAIKVATQYDSSVYYMNRANVQQLQMSALDAYFGVLLSQKALDVSLRSLERKKELFEFLDRNFKLGAGAKAQILATQADLKTQFTEIAVNRQNIQSAMLFLSVQMGRSLDDAVQLDTIGDLPDLMSIPIPGVDEAIASARASRSDLRALQMLGAANLGGARIFNAMYLPTVFAQGSFGTAGTKPGDLVNVSDYRNWQFGVGVQWTPFDGFANSAKAEQYRSDARKLQIAHEALSKMIQIQVRNAVSECMTADTNRIAFQELLAAARESYELTKDNFRQGSGQYVELQLNEERLRQAELGTMNAWYRVVRSRAALQVAQGRDIIK